MSNKKTTIRTSASPEPCKAVPVKNGKAKKITCIVVLCLVLAILLGDFFGANYLVSFAIGRTTSGGEDVVPESTTTDETRSTVDENWEVIAEETKEWYENTDIETVSISSYDGLTLYADIYHTHPENSKWAILVHGYTASRMMMPSYGCMFSRHGYNLLAPDLKGHGESEGDYIGMGWPDRKDILSWIDVILERDPEAEIVLYGVSMGAATVMMTSGETLPTNVKAIVEDCGYTSVWDIFADEMDVLFHLPTFPLLNTASWIASWRAGYNFTEASSVEQVKKASVPMMFIHGSEDNFVHTDMVYQVYEACPTEKDIMVVENAGHGQSYYYAPQIYEERVFSFLENYVK